MPDMERTAGGLPSPNVFKDIFVGQYNLDEGGQRFLRELIGLHESAARKEGYREAVLELLDGLIHISTKSRSAIDRSFLKEIRENIGDYASFKHYMHRQEEEDHLREERENKLRKQEDERRRRDSRKKDAKTKRKLAED
jgi:hypothetical protein